MKKQDIKPFAWGFGVGAIVLLIVIFAAGWVVTSSSSEAKAEEMVREAVLDRLAPIAFAQFMQDPNKEEHIKEMEKLEYYGTPNRGDYVQKQGWATMPGEKESDSRVAYECARRIMALAKQGLHDHQILSCQMATYTAQTMAGRFVVGMEPAIDAHRLLHTAYVRTTGKR